MMEKILELADIHRSFGAVKALSEINLQIHKGERVALIGASGSGKTTLLRLLGAQLAPDRGEIRVLGRDPLALGESGLRELRSRLGYMPQDLGLVPNLRVLQNVVAGRCGRRSILCRTMFCLVLSRQYALRWSTCSAETCTRNQPESWF